MSKNRKTTRKAEKTSETSKLTYAMVEELPIALNVFPGSIEGDKVAYTTMGKDRAVLLYGDVKTILAYTQGKEVILNSESIPSELHGTYMRNISRKETEAQERITKETVGRQGYTITLNGSKITAGSVIGSYFQRSTFVKSEDGKPTIMPLEKLTEQTERILKDGKSIELYAGVDMIVSAIITPGKSDSTYSKDSTIDSKL